MGYYDIASHPEQNRLWWAIESVHPPDTDDEVFAALNAQDGSPRDKAAVAQAWGNPNAAQRLLNAHGR
jgi:hypothetical protein